MSHVQCDQRQRCSWCENHIYNATSGFNTQHRVVMLGRSFYYVPDRLIYVFSKLERTTWEQARPAIALARLADHPLAEGMDLHLRDSLFPVFPIFIIIDESGLSPVDHSDHSQKHSANMLCNSNVFAQTVKYLTHMRWNAIEVYWWLSLMVFCDWRNILHLYDFHINNVF